MIIKSLDSSLEFIRGRFTNPGFIDIFMLVFSLAIVLLIIKNKSIFKSEKISKQANKVGFIIEIITVIFLLIIISYNDLIMEVLIGFVLVCTILFIALIILFAISYFLNIGNIRGIYGVKRNYKD